MFGALISNLEPILRLGQPYYEYQASKDLLHKKLVLDKFRCRCVLVWISAKNVSKTYPIIITATNQYMKVGFLESWCDFRSYMVNLLIRRYCSMMSLHEPPQAGRWSLTSDVHVQCA